MAAPTTIDALHERLVPPLYKSALLLLGNPGAAERTSTRAFLSACPKHANVAPSGIECAAFQNLLHLCSKLQKNTHYLSEALLPDGDQSLVHALAALTYEDRVPLVLTLVCGYPTKVIARLCGCSEEAVNRRLSRAAGRVAAGVRGKNIGCGRESA